MRRYPGFGIDGGKLGTIFARAGDDVVFSYARSNEKQQEVGRAMINAVIKGYPKQILEANDIVKLAKPDAKPTQ